MRWMLVCVFLCLVVSGCEGSSVADSGPQKVDAAGEKKPAEEVPDQPSEPVKDLPQVNTENLDDFSKGIWLDMVNELLSPCGDPVSVARCVVENRKCKRCVPAARYVARLVDEGYSRDEIRDIYRVRYGDDSKIELSSKGSPLRGSPMAPVTIYEFSDFQCPHCRLASPFLKQVVDDSKGKVKLVFKQYPLPGHPKAREAAKATIAADKQGKFWEMHDLIFANQEKLAAANFADYAREIGLDVKRFIADMNSNAAEAKINEDRAAGKRVGVDSTPTIIVNDRRYIFPPDKLAEYIREELGQ
ncbi:MAG: thioredoxin domain-containing protein [Polyangiales bacterium]